MQALHNTFEFSAEAVGAHVSKCDANIHKYSFCECALFKMIHKSTVVLQLFVTKRNMLSIAWLYFFQSFLY